jgi:hypothetical protein
MEPTEGLKIAESDKLEISQLITPDILIQCAKEILKESNRSQSPLGHPPKPFGPSDHGIYQFLIENNGGVTKREELFDVFGVNEEARRIIKEKLLMMERFGLITIQGDLITIRKAKLE